MLQNRREKHQKQFVINKKAQGGELIQDFGLLIFIAFLLIIFFFLSGAAWKGLKVNVETIAEEQSVADQAHHSLYAWLQKPVEIAIENEKQKMTITELIKLSQTNPEYKAFLELEMQKAFQDYEYILRIETREIEAHLEALGSHPRFYIPSNETILVVLQIEKVK